MLDALVAGETDPEHLAKLAKGSLTPKVKPLAEALRGRFASHHAFLLGHAHRSFLSTLCGRLILLVVAATAPIGV